MDQVNVKSDLADLTGKGVQPISQEQQYEPGTVLVDKQPMSDEAKPSLDGYQLPTGYLDPEGNLHKDVWVREMTGEEEDILTARKVPVHQRMARILERCTIQVGPYKQDHANWSNIVKALTVSDRLFLMLRIRIVSLGHLFSFKVTCTDATCGKLSSQSVSLEDFKIDGMPDPANRVWEGELPKAKVKYKMKVQTGADEQRVAGLANSQNAMTTAMAARLVELNGKAPTPEQIKKLSAMDMNFLRDDMKKHEGNIDSDVDVECPHRGNQFKTEIEIGSANFFFPSAT